MTDDIYHRQRELTLQNLVAQNRRLKEKIEFLETESARNRNILDFHDNLERDFLSADSLEDLILKLINCLQIRPDIDFVTLFPER